jgi:hypothetical protein
MKYAEDFDTFFINEEVRDAIVPLESLLDFAIGYWLVALSQARMSSQELDLFVNPSDHLMRSRGTVRGNVVVDLFKATGCFEGPDYFCHASRFLFTSSSDRVRPASESARPR